MIAASTPALGTIRNNETRLGRQSADHPGLEPGMLRVQIPPEPLMKFMSSQSLTGQVQLLPDALKTGTRPVRLSVQDTSLSRWQGGFNSRTGHSEILTKWCNW